MNLFINSLKKYAILSKVAYCKFDEIDKKSNNFDKEYRKIIQKELDTFRTNDEEYFSDILCDNVISDFKLIDFSNSLVNIALFKDNQNQNILSIKGTDKLIDNIINYEILTNKLPSYCSKIVEFFNEIILKNIPKDEKIIITGHSLGGYLAQILAILYPEKIDRLYTFNAPGIFQGEYMKTFRQIISIINSINIDAKSSKSTKSTDNSVNFIDIIFQAAFKGISDNSKYEEDIKTLKALLNNGNNNEVLPLDRVFHIKTCSSFDDKDKLFKNIIQDFGDRIRGSNIYVNIGHLNYKNPIKNIIGTHSIDSCYAALEFCSFLLKNNHKLDNVIDEKTFYINPYNNNLYQNDYILKSISEDLQNGKIYEPLVYMNQNTRNKF